MPDPSSALRVLDTYTWVFAGLLAAYAAYTTHTQLATFKQRCISKPSPSPASDTTVDRTTEDAIKLETLEALARGINFDLRNAALKIITERATTEKNIQYLLHHLTTRHAPSRLRALKALRCLSTSASSFVNLCTPPTFRALVLCLHHTLPPTPDTASQKEALYILARLMTTFFQGKDLAVDAGIIRWLQAVEIPGYSTVTDAVFDPERFDPGDTSLWEIVTTIMDEHDGGRRMLIEAGLIVPGEDEDERGVEVEVEVEIIDVATAQRAQRAFEQVGPRDGAVGEAHWTQAVGGV